MSSNDEHTSCKLRESLKQMGGELKNEVLDRPNPSPERALELVQAISKEVSNTAISIDLMQTTRIDYVMGKAVKMFQKLLKSSNGANGEWIQVNDMADQLIKEWKKVVSNKKGTQRRNKSARMEKLQQQRQQQKCLQEKQSNAKAVCSTTSGTPTTIREYRARLIQQKKELYKDPPVLPPLTEIVIEDRIYGEPQRDTTTHQLTFPPGQNEETNHLLQDFHPNTTPEEILRAGAFGGTYFRAIVSGVTNVSYHPIQVLKDTVRNDWIAGLDKASMLTSSTYQAHVNKFGVKCGGSLGMWESSGWITEIDPYGWFQWYCRFFQGRRCNDDARQISRWLKCAGPKGRFRSQLCNKILAATAAAAVPSNQTKRSKKKGSSTRAGTDRAGDKSISPVIRQTLMHWGLEITPDILERHEKRS